MGCCISKCSRKRKRQDQENPNLVQDKLVITQPPISPLSLSSTKQLLSLPQSPTSTSSSVSSFSSRNGNPSTTSYSFTSSASLSSFSISKERSFSNEFLKSCVKENPHIIQNHVKSSFGPSPNKRSRASANSSLDFTLVRQKSLRREIEGQGSPCSFTKSIPRSPSPSRRFSSNSKENLSKRSISDKSIVANARTTSVRSENMRLKSLGPRHNLARAGPYSMTKERCTCSRIGSKINEKVNFGEVLACKRDYVGSNIPKEDIENPLIALDCFIFL